MKEIEELTSQDVVEMPILEFINLIQESPVKNYATVSNLLASAHQSLVSGFSLADNDLNARVSEKLLTLSDDKIKDALNRQYNIMRLMGEIKVRGEILLAYDYEKMPECFKQNKDKTEVN